MSARKQLETQIRTAWVGLPVLGDIQVKATEKPLDAIRKPTLLIRQRGIRKGASQGVWNFALTLTLISPFTDQDKAIDQLEDLGPAVLRWLERNCSNALHDDAEVVAFGIGKDTSDPAYLAYDIPLTVSTPKE